MNNNTLRYWIDRGYNPEIHELLYEGEYISGFQDKQTNRNIRKITRGAFWKRMGLKNLAILKLYAKDNIFLEAQLMMLSDLEYIDLDDKELQLGLMELVDAGMLPEEVINSLLADGNPGEIPEILL